LHPTPQTSPPRPARAAVIEEPLPGDHPGAAEQRGLQPQRPSARTELAGRYIPAPGCDQAAARSTTSGPTPRRNSARAAARPAIPPPTTSTRRLPTLPSKHPELRRAGSDPAGDTLRVAAGQFHDHVRSISLGGRNWVRTSDPSLVSKMRVSAAPTLRRGSERWRVNGLHGGTWAGCSVLTE
jgi:hypothetical protein